MTLLVCVYMGAWGVHVGIEENSGTDCQCSCPEWETKRNRYTVHVFQVGKNQMEKERKRGRHLFLFIQKNNQVVQMSECVCECSR